jgi:hypothetical protein
MARAEGDGGRGPDRLHPKAPESSIVNLLPGPLIAASDQVCDAVRDWRQKNLDD